jgi:putative transposase
MSPKKHDVPEALLTSLLADYQKPEDLIGENGLLKQLTKLLVEKALDAEMAAHLGHTKHEPVANPAGNTRNGRSKKTLKGDFGELPIEVPRDRHGTFEPLLIPKHQTRWTGFDDKVISLYARGMTVRDIQSHLEEMYGTEISPSLISSITDAVADEVKAWQARPLDPVYPIVYLDCIHVKVREGAVRESQGHESQGQVFHYHIPCLQAWGLPSNSHNGFRSCKTTFRIEPVTANLQKLT